MKRLRMVYLRGALAAVLVFGSATTPVLVPTALVSLSVTQTACGPDSLGKLHKSLNAVAHSLEAAVDTNGRLYESGIYGTVGTAPAIETRQKVARAIHDANEYLIQALDIAKGLTKETFEGKKVEILGKLTLAAGQLKIGHATIDLVLQSVAALINQAVAIVQLFEAKDTGDLRRAIPTIDRHLKDFGHIREIAV